MAAPSPGPAVALIELESLARGPVVTDAVLKHASVSIVVAEPVSPGKYLLVFSGPVADVQESYAIGLRVAGARVLDRLVLSHVSDAVLDAMALKFPNRNPNLSIGLVELQTVASTIRAADVAIKRAAVQIIDMRLAKGIGGKGTFSLAGAQEDIEAALEGAAAAVEPHLLIATEIIPRPHLLLQLSKK
jgi:microcompartment protein CcmL/EutN